MLLSSWLSLRFNTCNWERLPSTAGMLPVSLLPLRLNRVTRELETVMPSQAVMRVVVIQLRGAVPRRVSLASRRVVQSASRPGSSGSGSARLLVHKQNGSPRSDRSFSETLLQAVGIHPLNWLPAMFNLRSLERVPSSFGIDPVSWLVLRVNVCRLLRLPSCVGMEPVNWLLWRPNRTRLLRLPSAVGMVPVSWLFSILNTLRLLRLPSSFGIGPVSWLERRYNLCRLVVRRLNCEGIGPRQLVAPEV